MIRSISYIFIAVMFVIASLSPQAIAQEGSWGTEKGQLEVNFSGNYGSTTYDESDYNWTETKMTGLLGYFLTDNIELGLSLWVFIASDTSSSGETSDSSLNYPALFMSYNFNTDGNITPYVGLLIGTGSRDWSDSAYMRDDTIYGAFVGAKFFVSEWAAVTAQAAYDLITIKYSDETTEYDTTRFSLTFGLSAFF